MHQNRFLISSGGVFACVRTARRGSFGSLHTSGRLAAHQFDHRRCFAAIAGHIEFEGPPRGANLQRRPGALKRFVDDELLRGGDGLTHVANCLCERFHRGQVSDSLNCRGSLVFDRGAKDLFKELPLVRRELLRKDVPDRRCQGVRRGAEKDVPGSADGGDRIHVQREADLGKAATTDELEQIAFRKAGDGALRHRLECVGKLCGLHAMQETEEAEFRIRRLGIDQLFY
jgi:hypothetical protein